MSLSTEEEALVSKNVAKWIELKKHIKTHQKKITELKTAQKIVEDTIICTMKENDIPHFKLPIGSIELKTREAKKSISSKWIKEQIIKVVDGEDLDSLKTVIGQVLTEMENPPISIKESLVHSS
tara:strand:- start:112 stop:483 length:372 start_codon:yes stop_codon:yes gene_type:complete